MAIINQETQNSQLSNIKRTAQALNIDINNISDEERQDLIRQLEGELSRRRFGQQAQGALGTIGESFSGPSQQAVFDPSSGRVSSVSVGRAGTAKAPSQVSELINLEKFRLSKQIEQEKSEERKVKLEKQRFDLEQSRKKAIAEEALEKEKARLTGKAPGLTPDVSAPAEIAPSAPVAAPITAPTDAAAPSITPPGIAPEQPRFEDIPTGLTERPEIVEGRKISGKRAEEASKANVNFEKTANLFSGIVAQQKGKEEEQGGLGLLPGLKGAFNVALKNPEFSRTASAFGQRAETAFALNSVLTGQNRVIRGVINMILGSLPGDFDPDTVVAAKTAQSLRNAYMITRTFKQAGLTSDILFKMTQQQRDNIDVEGLVGSIQLPDDEEAFLEARIDAVLSTPPAKKRTLLGERGAGIQGETTGGTAELSAIDQELADIERQLGGR